MTNKNLRIGVVGFEGGWSSEAIADRVKERTGFRLIVDLADVTAELHKKALLYRGHNLCDFDALIVKKVGKEYSPDMLDRIELLRLAEACGVKVFSKPESLLRMLDRLSCTTTLVSGDIPMPPTVIVEGVGQAVDAVHQFEAAVFKPLFSTKARGMCVIKADDPQLAENVRSFKAANPVMYIQKMIDIPGKDLGVMFLGGEYVSTYARVRGQAAWNTTTKSGGHYEAHDPSPEIIELARRAQALFNLTLTAVDVVETSSGPMVFEVSAFGGFRGLKEARGIDVAQRYVDYVIGQVNGVG